MPHVAHGFGDLPGGGVGVAEPERAALGAAGFCVLPVSEAGFISEKEIITTTVAYYHEES